MFENLDYDLDPREQRLRELNAELCRVELELRLNEAQQNDLHLRIDRPNIFAGYQEQQHSSLEGRLTPAPLDLPYVPLPDNCLRSSFDTRLQFPNSETHFVDGPYCSNLEGRLQFSQSEFISRDDRSNLEGRIHVNLRERQKVLDSIDKEMLRKNQRKFDSQDRRLFTGTSSASEGSRAYPNLPSHNRSSKAVAERNSSSSSRNNHKNNSGDRPVDVNDCYRRTDRHVSTTKKSVTVTVRNEKSSASTSMHSAHSDNRNRESTSTKDCLDNISCATTSKNEFIEISSTTDKPISLQTSKDSHCSKKESLPITSPEISSSKSEVNTSKTSNEEPVIDLTVDSDEEQLHDVMVEDKSASALEASSSAFKPCELTSDVVRSLVNACASLYVDNKMNLDLLRPHLRIRFRLLSQFCAALSSTLGYVKMGTISVTETKQTNRMIFSKVPYEILCGCAGKAPTIEQIKLMCYETLVKGLQTLRIIRGHHVNLLFKNENVHSEFPQVLAKHIKPLLKLFTTKVAKEKFDKIGPLSKKQAAPLVQQFTKFITGKANAYWKTHKLDMNYFTQNDFNLTPNSPMDMDTSDIEASTSEFPLKTQIASTNSAEKRNTLVPSLLDLNVPRSRIYCTEPSPFTQDNIHSSFSQEIVHPSSFSQSQEAAPTSSFQSIPAAFPQGAPYVPLFPELPPSTIFPPNQGCNPYLNPANPMSSYEAPPPGFFHTIDPLAAGITPTSGPFIDESVIQAEAFLEKITRKNEEDKKKMKGYSSSGRSRNGRSRSRSREKAAGSRSVRRRSQEKRRTPPRADHARDSIRHRSSDHRHRRSPDYRSSRRRSPSSRPHNSRRDEPRSRDSRSERRKDRPSSSTSSSQKNNDKDHCPSSTKTSKEDSRAKSSRSNVIPLPSFASSMENFAASQMPLSGPLPFMYIPPSDAKRREKEPVDQDDDVDEYDLIFG